MRGGEESKRERQAYERNEKTSKQTFRAHLERLLVFVVSSLVLHSLEWVLWPIRILVNVTFAGTKHARAYELLRGAWRVRVGVRAVCGVHAWVRVPVSSYTVTSTSIHDACTTLIVLPSGNTQPANMSHQL